MSDITKEVIDELLSVGASRAEVFDLPDDNKGILVPDGYRITTYKDPYKLPPHIAARTTFSKLDSFLTYVHDFKTETTRLFGTYDNSQIIAYLDYHGQNGPEAIAHSSVLTLMKSTEWANWTGINGKALDQVTFAEFLEENRLNVINPDGATLLDIVTTLEAKTEVTFQSSIRLGNGTAKLNFQEEQTAKGGGNGSLDIPTMLQLGLPVYRYGTPYTLSAFLRMRIQGGKVSFIVKLDNPAKVVEAAFADICVKITSDLQLPVLEGNFQRA